MELYDQDRSVAFGRARSAWAALVRASLPNLSGGREFFPDFLMLVPEVHPSVTSQSSLTGAYRRRDGVMARWRQASAIVGRGKPCGLPKRCGERVRTAEA
jgi:hypothetical protein